MDAELWMKFQRVKSFHSCYRRLQGQKSHERRVPKQHGITCLDGWSTSPATVTLDWRELCAPANNSERLHASLHLQVCRTGMFPLLPSCSPVQSGNKSSFTHFGNSHLNQTPGRNFRFFLLRAKKWHILNCRKTTLRWDFQRRRSVQFHPKLLLFPFSVKLARSSGWSQILPSMAPRLLFLELSGARWKPNNSRLPQPIVFKSKTGTNNSLCAMNSVSSVLPCKTTLIRLKYLQLE